MSFMVFFTYLIGKHSVLVIEPSKITIESPAKILETKNRMGMNSVYHSGWILSFAIK